MRKLGGVAVFGLLAAVAVMVLLPRDLQSMDWLHKSKSTSSAVKVVPADFKLVAPTITTPDVTTLQTTSPAVPAAAPVIAVVAPTPPPADYRFTTASGLNMRAEPSVDAALVASLQKGTRVAVIEASGRWLQVTTDDGRSGWLSSNFVTAPAIVTTPAVTAATPAPKPQNNQLVSSVAK
jgi:hypothetical protein